MPEIKRYVGIDKDINGGMTDTGKIIRDAWVFGVIEETETCEGWNVQGIETLWENVNEHWEKHGFRVGALPPEIRERFDRVQSKAFAAARAAGWDPQKDVADD